MPGPKPRDVSERIKSNVRVDENGCWRWQLYVRDNGYGQIGMPGVGIRYVHRVAYETWNGPIPDGLSIDHLCRVRDCCNPGHLEAVTVRENNLRGVGPAAVNAQVTHCPAGHPYDAANTYRRPDDETRDCRRCRRAANERSIARRSERLAGLSVAQRTAGPGRKSECKAGHPLAGDNLYVDPRGSRQCRECRRAAVNRSHAKRMERRNHEAAVAC